MLNIKNIDFVDLKKAYEKEENITDKVNKQFNVTHNSIESILISYDLQAGSYIKNVAKNYEHIVTKYVASLAKVLNKFKFDSLIEVGIGEATTLANLVPQLEVKPTKVFGFDLSWSRIKYAKHYMKFKNVDGFLFTGNLFSIPLADDSIDIVYTSHSIEPNGGREKEALSELYRIAKKYVVLLEPIYEFANKAGQKRMDKHGYIKNVYKTAIDLGFNVIEYRLFDYCTNVLNPTGLIIIKKPCDDYNGNQVTSKLICPITKKRLDLFGNCYFSPEGLLAYPIIDDIPCLLSENAIVATHFLDSLDKEFWL